MSTGRESFSALNDGQKAEAARGTINEEAVRERRHCGAIRAPEGTQEGVPRWRTRTSVILAATWAPHRSCRHCLSGPSSSTGNPRPGNLQQLTLITTQFLSITACTNCSTFRALRGSEGPVLLHVEIAEIKGSYIKSLNVLGDVSVPGKLIHGAVCKRAA